VALDNSRADHAGGRKAPTIYQRPDDVKQVSTAYLFPEEKGERYLYRPLNHGYVR